LGKYDLDDEPYRLKTTIFSAVISRADITTVAPTKESFWDDVGSSITRPSFNHDDR
jgi:hypothetical protein